MIDHEVKDVFVDIEMTLIYLARSGSDVEKALLEFEVKVINELKLYY